MPTTYKVLGQSKPTAATATGLYTVPSSTSAVVSTLSVANITGDNTNIRVAVRPAGATLEDKHYIVYNASVPGNSTVFFTIGMTLATTDVITIYDVNGKCSFNLFGSEIS